jgi:putative ABC transport system permease protein
VRDPGPVKALQFYEELLARMRATPGVELAGVTTMLPMGYGSGWGKLLTIIGQPEPASLDRVPSVLFQLSSSDYLPAIGARLRAGRFFTQADTGSSQPVAIVNETFVNRFMPGEDPIGREIYLRAPRSMQPPAQPGDNDAPRRVIIGVLADLKNGRLNRPAQAEVYSPYTQSVGEGWGNTLRLAIRSSGDPMSLAGSIRAQVSSLDPDQPVSEVASLDSLIGRSTSEQRFNALLMTVFAGLALLLAAFGTYGVISYTVEQQSHEIGVRMALGAQQRDVMKSVVGNGMLLAVIGAGVGLAASAALAKVIQSLLFEVQATDPITYISLALLLLVVAAVASYLPARRASRIDPMVALRYE